MNGAMLVFTGARFYRGVSSYLTLVAGLVAIRESGMGCHSRGRRYMPVVIQHW